MRRVGIQQIIQCLGSNIIQHMDNLSGVQKCGIIAGIGILAIFGVKAILAEEDSDQDLIQQTKGNSKQRNQNNKIAGLYNFGNTCFINSVIQALSAVQQFQYNLEQLIADRVNHKKSNENNFQFLDKLLSCMKSINSNQTNSPVSIENILDSLFNISKQLCNEQQQDSHQFFLVIATAIDQIYSMQGELSLSSSLKETKVLGNVLIGYTQSCIECQVCKIKRSIKLEAFYNLSLEIDLQGVYSLEDALRKYQTNQSLQNVNCQFCSIKNFTTKKERLIKTIRNRESIKQQNKDTMIQALEKLIKYSEKLKVREEEIESINHKMSMFIDTMEKDLLPLFKQIEQEPQNLELIHEFVEDFVQIKTPSVRKTKISKYPKVLVVHFKRLVMNPYSGNLKLVSKYIKYPPTLSFGEQNSQIIPLKGQKQRLSTSFKGTRYTLTSLIAYIGSGQSGHYYAFRKKNKDSQKWFYVSDKYVQEMSWEETKSQIAYMLYYQT